VRIALVRATSAQNVSDIEIVLSRNGVPTDDVNGREAILREPRPQHLVRRCEAKTRVSRLIQDGQLGVTNRPPWCPSLRRPPARIREWVAMQMTGHKTWSVYEP